MPTNGASNDQVNELSTPDELDHWSILHDVQAKIQSFLNKPGSCPWHLRSNYWRHVVQ